MSLLDKVVATEADAVTVLVELKAGVSVSSGSLATVQNWADWRVNDMKNTVAKLVPGAPAAAIQTALAAAQLALNLAGSNALSAPDRFAAVRKAEIVVGALADLVVS